jgi:hypothetical protein
MNRNIATPATPNIAKLECRVNAVKYAGEWMQGSGRQMQFFKPLLAFDSTSLPA